MRRHVVLALLALLVTVTPALAQTPPPFATRKITDNVYAFRYGGHQAMFVVTPDGIIATDPTGNIERFCEYWGRGY